MTTEETRSRAEAMFIYFSGILKKEVKDKDGVFIGRVWDISSKFGETYPKLEDLIIVKGFWHRSYAVMPWRSVISFDDDVILNIRKSALKFGMAIKNYEFLIKRDILDQQVVDTFNHKVRRVNDIHLLKVEHDLVVAHVDIGLRGLVRRLGCERVVDFLVRMVSKNAKYLRKEELVGWKYVQPVTINPASMTMKLSVAERQIGSIPAADLGDIIFDLNKNQRMRIFRALDLQTKAKVFENIEFEEQLDILMELDKKEAAQIVTHMSSDEAADLLERLPSDSVRNLLVMMESSRAKKLSTLLGYSSDSAGGLMTTDFISMLETMSAGSALEAIKDQPRDVETAPFIYITDEKNHLKGITTIRRILHAEPGDSILKTIFPKTLHVHLRDGMKEVAYLMDKYKVTAIPVVDNHMVLNGVITMDDVLSQVIAIAWRKRPGAPKGI